MVGYGGSYDMLPLSFLLCVYGRTIAQCPHNDKYPGDQPILVSCQLLLDSLIFQTRCSQVVILVHTSEMESLTQYSSIHKKPYPPTYPAQENLSPHTKLLLLKYIHQDLDILPYICPGDTTDEKQCRSDRKFIP